MSGTGNFALVVHTHQPYVRKNGAWPVGEDWLYQVMSETYIPLLRMLAQLEDEGLSPCLAVTMTPVLCEQLADPYIQERFVAYLDTMARNAESDIRDFEYFADKERRALAESYYQDYMRKRLAFLTIDGDLLAALASFEASGMVETIASAATHAFLPGLADWRSVRYQVQLGLESHRRHLGVDPAGFWIPECAYREGLETLLEAEGVRYMLVDPTAFLDGLPPTYPCFVGSSRVAAIARSDRAHENAWDESVGYPTDDVYVDSTKYYNGSGLHYWRVTGPGVSIEDKAVYEPLAAQVRALDHARHFIDDVTEELGGTPPPPGDEPSQSPGPAPIVLASYDTEFFGHGWKEGVYWLEVTLRSLEQCRGLRMTTPSLYLDDNAPSRAASLRETTWGTGKDDSTWINPSTRWMWDRLGEAQEKMFALAGSRSKGEAYGRALAQAAREVLLLESSDWPYMVAKDRAKGYSIERFNAHSERFQKIAGALERDELEKLEPELTEIEEVDNIFQQLDLDTFFGPWASPTEER